MKTKDIKNIIIEKKNELKLIGIKLKDQFVGLDDIVDELIELVSSWYLFPQAQQRPCVINIWGMTGTGKSALINKFIELLEYKSLSYRMDMGEFDSESTSWLKTTFTNELSHFNNQSSIICLDEIQFARTIKSDGSEIGNDKYRVIWELLDTGKLTYIPSEIGFTILKIDKCLDLLEKCFKRGVIVKNGIIESGLSDFIEIFNGFRASYMADKNKIGKDYFIQSDFATMLDELYDNPLTTTESYIHKLKQCDLNEIMDLVQIGFKNISTSKVADLSKSLIFILGNLDEAYYMSSNMNPDISADELYEKSCAISIIEIKAALKKRFRNEQIARLGNNHILYRAFNNENYREIIRRRLKEVQENIYSQFNLKINFGETVVDIIYIEGVFPAQGTRPVFTTIGNLVESQLSKIVSEFINLELEEAECYWTFKENYFDIQFFDQLQQARGSITIPLRLRISELRNKSNVQLQAFTAVHESGHAIVAALILRIVPKLIISKAVDARIEGFCMVDSPDNCLTLDLILKQIMIGIAGYVAEKIVFGDQNTSSGVYGDLERITQLASEAIKEYGMGKSTYHIKLINSADNYAMQHTELHSKEIANIINECEMKATDILIRNKLLLLKMSEYLSTHSKMEKDQIKDMIIRYSTEKWVSEDAFIDSENYFNFYNEILQQIDELNVLENGIDDGVESQVLIKI